MTTRSLRSALTVGALALLALLAGCATLEGLVQFSDPRIGFLVSGATGNEEARSRYAGILADAELAKIRRPLAETLSPLLAYAQALSREFTVSSDTAGSADLAAMGESQRARIAAYFAANPSRLAIAGKDYSAEWAREVAKVERAIAALQSQRAGLVAQAEAAIAQKKWEEVMPLCDKAERIDPSDASFRQRLDGYRRAWANGTVESLAQEAARDELARCAQIQKESFGTKADLSAVNAALALLDKVNAGTAEIRARLAGRESLAPAGGTAMTALEGLEKSVAGLRVKCWGEYARLMGEQRRYWDLYRYLADRMGELSGLPKHAAAILRPPLVEIYGSAAPKAMAYYVGTANDRSAEDAHGVALVFCRMAQEIGAYARRAGIRLGDEAATWEARAQESVKDCQRRLKGLMARRIVVRDFVPQGQEGGRLAGLVFDAGVKMCTAVPLAGKPARLWAVTMERDVKDPDAKDYVIDGTISALTVNPLPPQEIKREIVKVGLDPRVIPNPAYTPKSEEPLNAFAQDVLLYQRTELRQGKEVRFAADLTCKHGGATSAFLCLTQQWPNAESPLPGVTIAATEVRLDPPIMGPPRISINALELKPDPLPRAQAADLSSDQQIRDAVLLVARDEIVGRLERLAGAYPLRDLLQPALAQQKAGKALEAAESLGRCLDYGAHLAEAGRPAADARSPSDWIAFRTDLQAKLRDLAETLWQGEDETVRARMIDIWNLAVAGALDTLKGKETKP